MGRRRPRAAARRPRPTGGLVGAKPRRVGACAMTLAPQAAPLREGRAGGAGGLPGPRFRPRAGAPALPTRGGGPWHGIGLILKFMN